MRLIDPQTDDIAALAALHARAFDQGWSAKSLRDLLAMPGAFAYGHETGFILARAAANEAEILTLAVAPEARRKGLGTGLVMAAATHAQSLGATSLFLEVAADNGAALALYQGLGFKKVGQRRAYYSNRDAHVLRAALPLPKPEDFA